MNRAISDTEIQKQIRDAKLKIRANTANLIILDNCGNVNPIDLIRTYFPSYNIPKNLSDLRNVKAGKVANEEITIELEFVSKSIISN